jgi:hypothetical protein
LNLFVIAPAGRQPGHPSPRRPHVYTKLPAIFLFVPPLRLRVFVALFSSSSPDDNRRYPRKTSRRAAFRSRRRIVRFQ